MLHYSVVFITPFNIKLFMIKMVYANAIQVSYLYLGMADFKTKFIHLFQKDVAFSFIYCRPVLLLN